VLAPSASMNNRIAMYNGNALKIGLFGANCSSGRSATTVPERWAATWPECLALARLADEAGLDFMLPIARWKGYGGDTDFHGRSLETITWAVGLLCATKRMTVFGTVHAPLFHPLIAAKEFVTADHIGEGRVGVNIVVGWNEGEFEMFGVKQREHDVRYDYAQEWIDVVKQAWSCDGTFDFDGKYLQLKDARAYPKPYGDSRPLLMNAGSSDVGQAFALKNCDAFFVATSTSRTSLAGSAVKVTEVKAAAQQHDRNIEVFTVGQVICRPTQKEADDYYQHVNIDNADWGAIDCMLANKGIAPQTIPPEEYYAKRRFFAANSIGGYPFVGTPDRIAEELTIISQAGVRGIGLSFVNFLAEVPYFCDEVLPRLQRAGVRVKQ
jgi:dimethylsulfone monooxygenase